MSSNHFICKVDRTVSATVDYKYYILDIDNPGNLRAEKQEIERHKPVKM